MSFYTLPSVGIDTLRQGDLLEGVPFHYFDIEKATVVCDNGQTEYRDLSLNREGIEYSIHKIEFGWGIVLNQNCDLQPNPKTGEFRDPILLARVRQIQEVVLDFDESTPKKALTAVNNLSTEAKSPNIFYLPAYESDQIALPRSGVQILDVQRYSPNNHLSLHKLLRLRLSDTAQRAFQSRCAYCFGRFAAPEGFYFSEEEKSEKMRQEEERKKSQRSAEPL